LTGEEASRPFCLTELLFYYCTQDRIRRKQLLHMAINDRLPGRQGYLDDFPDPAN
jgi:hypothetical protein